MTNLYKQFRTDKGLEQEGIVLAYGKNSQGKDIEIRIARSGGGNQAFAKSLELKMRPYRRQLQTDTMENEVAEKLMKEVYASTVVLGWSGVEFPVLDADGQETGEYQELNFNVDNCIRLFNDLPELWADIQQQSSKAALFRKEILERDAKN